MRIKKTYFFFNYIFSALCLLAVKGFAQSSDIKKVDSLRVELWKYVFTDAEKAQRIGDEAMEKAKNISYAKGLADVYAKLGVLFDITGKPEKALPYFLNAIKIQEEIKDSAGLSFSNNNLGLMYYAQYNYKEAYKYLNFSLAIDLKRKDYSRAAGAMVNLGIVNTYMDSVERSLQLYANALKLYEDMKDTTGIMSCYSNMGSVYFYKRDYKRALEFYEQNEKFLENSDNAEKKASCYNTLANTYSKIKLFDKALAYAYKDLLLCERNKLVNRRQFAYESLNDIYVEMGDYKNAHIYLNKYILLRDSLLNEDRNDAISEMQAKYEAEKKDKELIRINAEKDIAIQKGVAQRKFIIVISIVFLLVLLIIVLALRSRQRITKLLQEKNRLNVEIISQKELLIGEVHHRVKNNLQLINSIVDLQSKNYTDENTVAAVGDIQKRVNAIALLHQFLYQKDSLDNVDMREYLCELAEGLKKSFQSGTRKIEVLCTIEAISLHLNTAVPLGLIVNELITNSFKHAFEGRTEGQISIVLKRSNTELMLEISDNGVGTEPEGKGNFGKQMIRSLCRQLQAEWKTESGNGLKNVFLIKKFRADE